MGWWEQGNRRIHYDRFNQNKERGRGSIRTPGILIRLAQPAFEGFEPLGAACGSQRECGLYPACSERAASPSGAHEV
jgi:hypothetical protein